MKLKDWDDQEESAGKIQPKDSRKADTDDKDKNLGDTDALDRSAGKTGRDMEPSLRKSVSVPERDTGQSLRRRTQERDTEPEEELAPLPIWAKALIFVGLAVLAAIICALLWRFVHPDRPEEESQGYLAESVGGGDSREPEPGTFSTPESGSTGKDPAESGFAGSVTDPASEPSAEPEQETADPPASAPAPLPGGQASGQTEASGAQPTATPESPQPTAEPQSTPQPTAQPKPGNPEDGTDDMRMTFTAVQESVTPKDAVNLRTMPTTTDDRSIVVKIQNGEALSRTGINNDTGWSRIDYNGQTLYAVSQYLTTDLNYKTPVAPTDPNRVTTADGTEVIFENCDDWITPKEYVNLRTEPSTLQGDAAVSCQLNYGENAHRTGFSADFGWSRVEYNGQVLYVVTSFVYTVSAQDSP